jgi:hypothetical protein
MRVLTLLRSSGFEEKCYNVEHFGECLLSGSVFCLPVTNSWFHVSTVFRLYPIQPTAVFQFVCLQTMSSLHTKRFTFTRGMADILVQVLAFRLPLRAPYFVTLYRGLYFFRRANSLIGMCGFVAFWRVLGNRALWMLTSSAVLIPVSLKPRSPHRSDFETRDCCR